MSQGHSPIAVKVFVSGTFTDTKAERNYLCKVVLPYLTSLYERRGVVFTGMDLRWGFTPGNIFNKSLCGTIFKTIDSCAPFFIGILGERYGWVPPFEGVAEEYRNFFIQNASSVEAEFTYGVFGQNKVNTKAVFCFRALSFSEELGFNAFDNTTIKESWRIKSLKEKLICNGCQVLNGYTSLDEFGEFIIERISETVRSLYPDVDELYEFKNESIYHSSFNRRLTEKIGRERIRIMLSCLPEELNQAYPYICQLKDAGWNIFLKEDKEAYPVGDTTLTSLLKKVGTGQIESCDLLLAFVSDAYVRNASFFTSELAYAVCGLQKDCILLGLDDIKEMPPAVAMLTAKKRIFSPRVAESLLTHWLADKNQEMADNNNDSASTVWQGTGRPVKQDKPFSACKDNPFMFVSYAHDDAALIYPIIKELYESGWNLWYDEGIEVTEAYLADIAKHVKDCDTFLLFLTPRSIKRPFVIDFELAYANRILKKKIIPILVEPVSCLPEDVKDYVPVSVEQVEVALRNYGFTPSERRNAIPPKDKKWVSYDIPSLSSKKDVVFCFAECDRDIVEGKVAELKNEGIDTFCISVKNMKDEIFDAKLVILVLSPTADLSFSMRKAVFWSAELNKSVVPVYCKGFTPGILPLEWASFLNQKHGLFFDDLEFDSKLRETLGRFIIC